MNRVKIPKAWEPTEDEWKRLQKIQKHFICTASYKEVKKVMSNTEGRIVNDPLLKHFRDKPEAAIYLTYLIGFAGSVQKDSEGGWFYRKQSDIEDDIYLSRHRQKTCQKRLVKENLLQTKQWAGNYTYYRLNTDRLKEIFNDENS